MCGNEGLRNPTRKAKLDSLDEFWMEKECREERRARIPVGERNQQVVQEAPAVEVFTFEKCSKNSRISEIQDQMFYLFCPKSWCFPLELIN